MKLKKKPKYFFSSSVCIYKDMPLGARKITEDEAYPAFGKKYDMSIRIARFHTTYGPEANWEGGREKAADAICRKVALAKDGWLETKIFLKKRNFYPLSMG